MLKHCQGINDEEEEEEVMRGMNTAQLSGRKSMELQMALKQQQSSGAGTKGFTRVAEAATVLSRLGRWDIAPCECGLSSSLPKEMRHSFPGARNF